MRFNLYSPLNISPNTTPNARASSRLSSTPICHPKFCTSHCARRLGQIRVPPRIPGSALCGLLGAPTGTSSASQKGWSSNSSPFVNTSRTSLGWRCSRWILVEGCTPHKPLGSALQVNRLSEYVEWLGITSGPQSCIFGAESAFEGLLLSL